MFAQLGKILFENLKTPRDFSERGEAVYAEHALIDGKPKLQRTGSALQEIDLSIRLHVSFCNPKNEFDALVAARNSGEIMSLLWGNGSLQGDYVITEIQSTIEDADGEGNVFSYSVDISLKEYVGKSKIQQEQEDNINNAKAVGDKQPVAKRKVNAMTCPQTVSSIVSRIEGHSLNINRIVLERGGATNAKNKGTIKSNCTAITKLCENLMTRVDDIGSCAHDYPQIKTQSSFVKNECVVMIVYVDSSPDQVAASNSLLQSKVTYLKNAARPLIQKSITRK